MYEQRVRRLNSKRGMTLVELLMVMAILSVVMMAVMSLYIPMHQSTVAQTQVSDVQSNLRLALNTMTQDLLTAGFLASRYPIVFPDADTAPDFGSTSLTDIGTQNSTDFIIRTRAVGSGFARIASASHSGNTFQITVADPDMVPRFPGGTKVRIFGSMNGEELIEDIKSSVSSANRVLSVVTYNSATIEVDVPSAAALTSVELNDLENALVEAVIVRVKDDSQPSLQTIRYRLNNGVLERIVNGSTQFLARNVDSVDFGYSPPSGRINLVHVKLTGKTKALKNDAISGEKTREVETSVRLRNIF